MQGASWALVIIGAVSFFTTLYPLGFLIAFFGAFLGSLAGLFFVIMLEIANIQIEKLEEVKKQTTLLEQLVNNAKVSDN